MTENVNFNLLIVCSMSCNITVSVSDDFAKEAKRLAKKYPSFKQDYKVFLESIKNNPLQGDEITKTYAKSVWLSKLKAKVNLVEQGSLPSMTLQMWKTVRWFFFFSMIKRMLQPSKSMLSSNLCETWDLILNESIKGCIVFLIYFFCPSQDILGISVNHLYKWFNPQTA